MDYSFDPPDLIVEGCRGKHSSAAEWRIKWEPADDEQHGYIIQRVAFSWWIAHCDRSVYEISKKCGEPNMIQAWHHGAAQEVVEPLVYWELWMVDNRKVYKGHRTRAARQASEDVLKLLPVTGRFGRWSVRADAFFYETEDSPERTPPPGGWDIWQVDPTFPARDLAYTCTFPKLAEPESFPVHRAITLWFCCCGEPHDVHWSSTNGRGRCGGDPPEISPSIVPPNSTR